MKRIAFCLALLACGGCMMDDGFVHHDGVWYEAVEGDCTCSPGPAARVGSTPPRVVPVGSGVIPAGGAIPAPPPRTPQTPEPELLRK